MAPLQPTPIQALFFAGLALFILTMVLRAKTTEVPKVIAILFLGYLASDVIAHGPPWRQPWPWYFWTQFGIGLVALGKHLRLRFTSSPAA